MKIYEVEWSYIDDSFTLQFYSYGLFLQEENAIKELEKQKERHKNNTYVRYIKIKERETKD